ncbi:MAG: hypothetical protein WDM94_09885 [Bauldia sp.]
MLGLSSVADAATWCDQFSSVLNDLMSHKFRCDQPGDDSCVADSSTVELPGTLYCNVLISVGIADRDFYCPISQPTPELERTWGEYLRGYFDFCAENGLLNPRGQIVRDFLSTTTTYRTAQGDFVRDLDNGGVGLTFSLTYSKAR